MINDVPPAAGRKSGGGYERIAALGAMMALWTSTAHAASAPVAAQSISDGLEVSLNFRLRAETISGQFRPDRAEDDLLVSLRTNLFVEYDAGPIRLGGELLDARGYGEKQNSSLSTSEVNALEPLQAYAAADLGDILGHGYSGLARIGRFTLEIGSSRLVGRPDSSNAPTAYTGAVIDLVRANKDRLVLFWTMPNLRLPGSAEDLRHNRVKWDRSTDHLVFYGGSYNRASIVGDIGGEAYLYRLAEQDAPVYPTRNRRLTTYGFRLQRKPGKGAFDFDIEAARQRGSIRATAAPSDLAAMKVRAGFAHAEIGRKLEASWSPRVSAVFDYGSGDDARSPARYGRFDGLFGARRSDLNYTGLYGPLNWSNLVSAGARLEGKPSAAFDFFLLYRANWLDQPSDSFAATSVRDRNGTSGRFAGHQVEARGRQWLVKDRYRLELGGAWFGKGRFLNEAPNAPATGDTLYGYTALYASF
jgi:hypothetical protein